MGTADRSDTPHLPPVDVDVDAALDRTRGRGARRRRRRAAVLGVGAVAVVVLLGAVAVAATRDHGEDVVADGPTTTTAVPPVRAPAGDPAIWHIDPTNPPEPGASTFTALVSRIGCHGGVTGTVNPPGIMQGDEGFVITFTVERAEPGDHTCPGNDAVPYEVDIGLPIADDLLLRDGMCLREPLVTRSECVVDDGTSEGRFNDVRWPEGAVLEPRECEAHDGSPLDVAHEPDWRRYADYSTITDSDGCIVRIDVLAERSGSDHCGQGAARVLITGDPFGTPYGSGADSVHYVRDPDGLFGDPGLAAGYREELTVPSGAGFTGYLIGDRPIWIDPDDPDAVWVIAEDTTAERWPRGKTPPCN
jgi:hypothetical protein